MAASGHTVSAGRRPGHIGDTRLPGRGAGGRAGARARGRWELSLCKALSYHRTPGTQTPNPPPPSGWPGCGRLRPPLSNGDS